MRDMAVNLIIIFIYIWPSTLSLEIESKVNYEDPNLIGIEHVIKREPCGSRREAISVIKELNTILNTQSEVRLL